MSKTLAVNNFLKVLEFKALNRDSLLFGNLSHDRQLKDYLQELVTSA